VIDSQGQSSIIETARRRIVDAFSPLRLILFGSRARDDATADSDIDLLVIMPDGADKRRTAIEIRRALRDLPLGKDIIVSTPEEIARRGRLVGTVLQPALREGRVLFERG
jgi:predicted nucleotidyltransferase